MRQIGKSYLKLFIKSWMETLGTVLFLMIFTMIILGMLATPLQLSLHAAGVNKKTNTWDAQGQRIYQVNEDFAEKILYNGEKYSINYGTVVDQIAGGWFTDTTKSAIDKYVEHESTSDEEAELKSRRVELIQKLVTFARTHSMEEEYKIALSQKDNETPETIAPIKGKDIYRPEVQALFQANGVFNNPIWYIYNQILNLVSSNEPNFNYNTFQKLQSIVTQNNVSMNYVVEAYNSIHKSDNDGDLNNLIVNSGPKTLNPYKAGDQFIEGYVNDLFLKAQNLKIGNIISVPFHLSRGGGSTFLKVKVMGVAEKYSTLTPYNTDILQSMDNFAQIFVDTSLFDYENLYGTNGFLPQDFIFDRISNLNIQEYYIKNSKYSMNDYFVPNELNSNLAIHSPGETIYRAKSDHIRISQITNLTIMTWIFSIIGGILFVLAFFFITFVLKKEINSTRRQLGVFKSIGYTTKELTWVFSLKTFLTMFVAIVVGLILSFPFQINAATRTYSGIVIFSFQEIYANPIFLVIVTGIVPLLFAGLSYLIIFKYLNESALTLLSTGPKEKKRTWIRIIFYVIFPFTVPFLLLNHGLMKLFRRKNICFTYRMQDSFIQKGKGKYLLVMTLVGFTAFLFTIQLRAMPIMDGIINGAFNMFEPNVDHYYNFDSVSRLTYQEKVRLSPTVTYPDIKYIDYSEWGTVENYIEQQGDKHFTDYEEIHELMEKLTVIRDEVIESGELDSYKEALTVLMSGLALFYPLDDLENLTKDNIKKFILGLIPPGNENLEKLKDTMKNGNNVYNLKNNEDKNTGMWLSDVGRYLCLTAQSANAGSCQDVTAYQKQLVEKGFDFDEQENEGGNSESGIEDSMNSIFASWISEFLIRDLSTDQFISTNTVLFNKNTDLLTNQASYYISNNNDVDSASSSLIMFDTNENYGKVRNAYNFSSITDNQFTQLRENTNELPVIVSARLSRLLNKKVGDTFEVNVGYRGKIIQPVKIIGISENDNMTQSIYVDYDNFMNRNAEGLTPGTMYFNNIISQNISFEGSLDLSKLQNISTMFKNKLPSTALTTSVGVDAKQWLGTILDVYLKNIDKLANISGIPQVEEMIEFIKDEVIQPSDKDVNYFINANPLNGNMFVLPIIKSAINGMMDQVKKSLYMYIAIDIVLMIILLVVIMNIVVNDSINIITIMRSLGYTDKKINWIVMGRYIIGSIIVFIFSYVASIVLWEVVKAIVWSKFKMLIIIPTLPWIPIVSFIVIAAIMICGWLAAMYQIKNKPLTYLSS